MGIYVRPDSPFLWMLLERPNQKPIRESTNIPADGGSPAANREQRRQAQEVYAKRMADLSRRRFKLPTTLEGRTFKQHREWYETNVSAHKRGVSRERSMLKQLGAFFDAYDLSAIDATVAREWRTWRRETVKASTVNREEEILKHMLNQAVPKYLDANPLAGLARLRTHDVEIRILTREEETRLLKAATKPDDKAAVLCGLDALMRRGSVLNLKRAQDHGQYLTLLNAKAGSYKVPVSARLRKALDAVPDRGARYFEGYWPHAEHTLSRMFTELCAKANVTAGREAGGITFHALRHTGASRMLDAGVDVKTVMEIGGWRNLKVLERYLHPSDARKREAVNTIAKITRQSR